jgi:hypothetical protein
MKKITIRFNCQELSVNAYPYQLYIGVDEQLRGPVVSFGGKVAVNAEQLWTTITQFFENKKKALDIQPKPETVDEFLARGGGINQPRKITSLKDLGL